ncbi:TetR/AcrR family transcriptional regulator [Rhodoplanes azumiensis]|uniref:TetR/AcrR family transcriptional regulator n=1 Tax=Rhodoplanes azumiensis TaxID=1897628 RepID=A0ABW5ARA8_9BRAD
MDQTVRKRDKEASKQALMQAGLSAFSTRGYDAATTKMIAADAGLNEQLITRYFGGKAGLLLAILASFVDEEANGRIYPAPAEDVETEIRQFLLYRHQKLLVLQDFFRAYLPLSLRDDAIRDSLRPILLRESAVLRDRLVALQGRGLIRADADLEAVSMIIGGLSFHASFLLRVNLDLPDDRLDHIISEFVRCMTLALAPMP